MVGSGGYSVYMAKIDVFLTRPSYFKDKILTKKNKKLYQKMSMFIIIINTELHTLGSLLCDEFFNPLSSNLSILTLLVILVDDDDYDE